MGLVDWRIVVAVAAMALVIALVGLRGRKADALPRCKRRRCRYDLSAFLGETRPGAGYPVTCPECGRAAQNEREVKWGRRKARRRVVWFGAVVLALCAMVGGVEVYARATNANTLAWMPLWLILDRAEGDTLANDSVHQRELLRRVDAGKIMGEAAHGVVRRILEWQQDEAVHWGTLGDIFASLAMKGYAKEEEIKQFWANVWILRVHTRETAVEGEWVAVEVRGDWRGTSRRDLVLAGSTPIVLPSAGAIRVHSPYFALVGTIDLEQDGLHHIILSEDDLINRHAPSRVNTLSGSYEWIPRPRPSLESLQLDEAGVRESYRDRLTFLAKKSGTTVDVRLDGRIVVAEPQFLTWPRTRAPAGPQTSLSQLLHERGFANSWEVDAHRSIDIVADGASLVRVGSSESMSNRLLGKLEATFSFFTPDHGFLEIRQQGLFTPRASKPTYTPFELRMAHRVFLRRPDGTEIETDMVAFLSSEPFMETGILIGDQAALFHDLNAPPVVVLRPDPGAARSVAGIDVIWDGVLEVPVQNVRPSRFTQSRPLLIPPRDPGETTGH